MLSWLKKLLTGYTPEEISAEHSTPPMLLPVADEATVVRTYQVFQDRAGNWRWRVLGNNGEKVSLGEAYSTKSNAVRSATHEVSLYPPGRAKVEVHVRVENKTSAG